MFYKKLVHALKVTVLRGFWFGKITQQSFLRNEGDTVTINYERQRIIDTAQRKKQ